MDSLFDHQALASRAQTPAAITDQTEHLVLLADASWGIWRWSAVRGTGFPVEFGLRLASAACGSAADICAVRENEVTVAQQQAIHLLVGEKREDDPAHRSAISKAIRSVKAGKVPVSSNFSAASQLALGALQEAQDQAHAAKDMYDREFATATQTGIATLRTLAGLDAFREALAWQNRAVLQTCVEHFLNIPVTAAETQHFRKYRDLLAKYVQRYCMKNDSIGFFGPIGWAQWQRGTAGFTQRPGPALLAHRTVYFETWGINALGQSLVANAAASLLLWAIPRLMPFVHLAGSTLHASFVKPLQLSDVDAAVLEACDGQRTALDIAQRLLSMPQLGLHSADEIYAVLQRMLTTRRITWSFDVSPEAVHPEAHLRRALERISDAGLRDQALGSLSTLDTALAGVQQAAGNAAKVEQAIGELEATFTALTGQSSTRSAGETYAARTLAYEDCRRAADITLGGDVLRDLEDPLGLLLTSARWLTAEIGQVFRQYFLEVYRELALKQNAPTVEFTQFFPWVSPRLFDTDLSASPLVGPVLARFQERWATILAIPADSKRLAYHGAALADAVHAAFDAPAPGWPLARYHSPDIMLAAPDNAAMTPDAYQLVMGELHLGMNTLDAIALVSQHPHPAELHEAFIRDCPEPLVLPAISNQIWPAKRTHRALVPTKDFRLVVAPDVCDAAPEHVLRSGDLILEERAGTVQVRTRAGHHQFDIMAVMSEYLSFLVGDCFALLPSRDHAPRITIDRLVVTRESWRFSALDIAGIDQPTAAQRYYHVRRWLREHDIPRFSFFHTPEERKPYFLDLASPLYVEIFVKAVRRLANSSDPNRHMTLVEMLPTPEQTWLVDAQGARYTSELRIVACDQRHS